MKGEQDWRAYRCIATSEPGFVQQVAVQYVAHGYWLWVKGELPARKHPAALDRKLIEKYSLWRSKTQRWRRRAQGKANVQYVRFQGTFVLLATLGVTRESASVPVGHPFFLPTECGGESVRDEAGHEIRIRDLRRRPLCVFGYAIGYRRERGAASWTDDPYEDRKWHASVRIEQGVYQRLKRSALEEVWRWEKEAIEGELLGLPCVPHVLYAPVRSQLRTLVRKMNARRKASGLVPIDEGVIPGRRPVIRKPVVSTRDREGRRGVGIATGDPPG